MSAYPSQSEADLALASILSFWTQDKTQIERLMNSSGLRREKWDRSTNGSTYLRNTIDKACQQGATYTQKPRENIQLQGYDLNPTLPHWQGKSGINALNSYKALLPHAKDDGEQSIIVSISIRQWAEAASTTYRTILRHKEHLIKHRLIRKAGKSNGIDSASYQLIGINITKEKHQVTTPLLHTPPVYIGCSNLVSSLRNGGGRSGARCGPYGGLLMEVLSGGEKSVRELVDVTGRSAPSIRRKLKQLHDEWHLVKCEMVGGY